MHPFFSFIHKIIKLSILAFVLCFLTVITQDFKIYSGAFQFEINKYLGSKAYPEPKNIATQKLFIQTANSHVLESWKFPSETNNTQKKVAIIFHGNSKPLAAIDPISDWLTKQGYTTYAFLYPGYGRSSGWPSENEIYQDAKNVVEYVSKEEKIKSENIYLIGYSLGSSIAAKTASEFNSKILTLLAPFARLKDVVEAKDYYKYFAKYLWSHYPTEEYVKSLNNTCLIIGEGEQDILIPKGQTERIISNFPNKQKVKHLISPTADHGNVFTMLKDQLTKALEECEKG